MATSTARARVLLTEALIRRHQKAVWRYLRFLGCGPPVADDLTQETFLRLLRNPPEHRGDAALGAWLRVTALNLFRNRGHRTRAFVPLDAEALEHAWQRDAGGDDGDGYLAALEPCLRTLPDAWQRALRLRYEKGGDWQAVAAGLGLGREGAKTLLRRARARLQACIELRVRRMS